VPTSFECGSLPPLSYGKSPSRCLGSPMKEPARRRRSQVASCVQIIFLLVCVCCINPAHTADIESVVAGLQRRYGSISTMTGSFRQTYRAPGIDQVESGVFWLKKPGLMRWEYRVPEEKLFVADGREAYLYVPADRQVTVQAFSAAEMHNTPLEFLLGSVEINRSFAVSWETGTKPEFEGTFLVRLTPRRSDVGYSYLVLELDQKAYDLKRIIICEPGGNTSEFVFADLKTNAKVDGSLFKFKAPKGVETINVQND
jgi:outer membrane lipoprotein carrier protein